MSLPTNSDFRTNERIRISPVVVIQDGKTLGTLTTTEALRLAADAGLDLVEISPNERPPVCRIMDYGKYKYEKSVRQKQQKKNSRGVQPKEIRLRPVTQDHDLETKIKAIESFLSDGHPVQLTMKFKAREIAHKELGFTVINAILDKVSVAGKSRVKPILQGKTLTCIVDPIK
jgi:translation initiation factor IF-3